MSACLLIAHPDDESMFFLPVIVGLRKRKVPIYLLCVTSGNAEGKGEVRAKELQKLAEYLQLAGCEIIDNVLFPDSMSVEWDILLLKEAVIPYLKQNNVKFLYTFDDYGVSGHCNHISLSFLAARFELDCEVFRLKSHSFFWKYSFITKLIDYRINNMKESYSLCLWEGLQLAYNCMKIHSSQLIWFRYLYIFFSRYTCKNEFI